MRSIRKIANGFAFTILLLFAAVTVALLVSCASSTQIEGANPASSMPQTINDFATLLGKALAERTSSNERTAIAEDKDAA